MIIKDNRSNKLDIKSMLKAQLMDEIKSMGLPAFRGDQIYKWLHVNQVDCFDDFSNISKDLREKLKTGFYINRIKVKKKLVSKLDPTVKYLFELEDGNCVESVLMNYKHGNSLCISTQVGCRMGCKFCASTVGGLIRNLTPAELLDQVYMAGKDSGQRVSSLVLMGIGEPLDNYENVIDFLKILSSEDGLNLSLRHVSLSTCGLVEKIAELTDLHLQLTLSISLHSPSDSLRSEMMPINNKYPIDSLIQVCRRYFNRTGRRISFEYALINGVNDSVAQAKDLAKLLNGMSAHVNLIPINEVEKKEQMRSTPLRIQKFKDELIRNGVNATVRRELGTDINAACGQLRISTQKEVVL